MCIRDSLAVVLLPRAAPAARHAACPEAGRPEGHEGEELPEQRQDRLGQPLREQVMQPQDALEDPL
eukprot:15021679-Alexandrium_andersonii.AAC.1